MKKTCYSFTINVITVKDGIVTGYERFIYVVEAGTYEKARAIATEYGQTIVRMREAQNLICYYRVTTNK